MTKNAKALALFIALTAWFAVIMQYVLVIRAGNGTFLEINIRFFSFFTILTNTLVAITFTLLLVGKQNFLTRIPGLTATGMYILVVGLVYNIILRFAWAPQGLQKLIDELLHSVVPLLVQFYWFVFVGKGTLNWKNSFAWLIYPAVYCVWIMVRGSFIHEYPYPFVDVNALGAGKVTLNCFCLCGVFFGLSLLYIGIDKWRGKRKMQR